MADDAFQLLRDWLRDPGQQISLRELTSSHQIRFAKAYQQWMREPESTGIGDLLALVRSVIRREQEIAGTRDVTLWLPASFPANTRQVLSSAGLEMVTRDADGFVITAQEWRPTWLPDS